MNPRKSNKTNGKLKILQKRSLSSRLSRISIVVVVACLLVVGSGLIFISSESDRNNTRIIQKKYAEKVASIISDYITDAADDLKLIDTLDILHNDNHRSQIKILENLIIYKNSIYSQIFLADKKGNEKIKVSRYHTYMDNEYGNLASEPQFTKALNNGFYISPVYISDESGLLSVQIALRTGKRNNTNVIIAELNITKLWQNISGVKIGRTGYAYLVNKSGKYIASQQPADVFKKYGMDLMDKPPVQAFATNREYDGKKLYRGIEGNIVIGAYSPISGTSWAVIAELPLYEAYENLRNMAIYFIALLIAGSFTAGLAGYFSAKRLVRHLHALTGAARKMGGGDLEVEIPGQTDTDEIGILARTLNLMRTELQALYADMRKNLADLTETRDALAKSEEKYRTIFENSGSALVLISEDNTLSIVNRQFELITGYSKSEIEGVKTWMELIADKNDLAKMKEYREKRLQGGTDVPVAYEFHLSTKTGTVIDVILTVVILQETKETFAAIVDISKLKETQHALTLSERRFMAVFNNSYQLIALTDTRGTIIESNQTSLNFMQLSQNEITGKDFSKIHLWSHSPEEKAKLEKAIITAAGGTPVRYETTNLSGDGQVHNIDLTIKPVLDDTGNAVMLIIEGRDITDMKNEEAARLKLEAQLRQSQKIESVGRLAGGIAHDFNNVLGGIMGTVSIIKHRFKKGPVETEYIKNMIDVIETSAKRAAGIVNQMLSLSRKQQTDIETIDLNSSVRNVVNLCRNSFDKGIIITEQYDL